MTISKNGLIGRWQQFDKAMRFGKQGHSGGLKAFEHSEKGGCVFVSAMPIVCDVKECNEQNLKRMGQVAYLEYEAFAEYFKHTRKRKDRPPYNTK
jgi:hypothetical protein